LILSLLQEVLHQDLFKLCCVLLFNAQFLAI
jgi:hypothetical protein